MNEIISILIANLALLLAISLWFYKSWLDGLRPDWFYIFRIYENGMMNYQEHKFFLPISKKKDNYTIDQCDYDKTGVRPYIDPKGVYTWNFIKGQSKAITFQEQENIDGKLISEIKKTSLDDIWFNNSGIEDFVKTYGIFIVALIMLLAIGYLINQNQKSSEFTTRLLINLTRRN